jgi:AraC-like DNA-binding protein
MNVYSNTDCQLSVLGDQPYPAFELRNIVRYLDQNETLSSNTLLDHVGLTRAHLEESFLPTYKVLAAMKLCAQQLGPIAGARIGATYEVSDLGVFGYAIASTQNLGHAIEIENKYYPLLGNLLKRGYVFKDNVMCTTMYNVQNIDAQSLSFFVALGNSARMHIARSIFGDDLAYNSMSFMFDDEANRHEYETLYGCPIEFNAPQNSWSIERSQFSRERKQGNHADCTQYLPYCNELIESLKQKDSLVNEIQQILVSCAGDYPDIEMLASAFNVSSRTLRRQLANIGTSYQKILNKVRCQLSIEYLTRTEINIDDISNIIGFNDVTNFRHAFKKWVGKTPSFYRKTYQQSTTY